MPLPTLEDDPCARATALRQARDDIITGGQAVEVEHQAGNGQHRRVKYGTADLARLDREIATADSACALKNGGARPRRFAIGERL